MDVQQRISATCWNYPSIPKHRGKNIGGTMIEVVATKATEMGYCKLALEVRTDNPAECLYRRLGFNDGNHPRLFLTGIYSNWLKWMLNKEYPYYPIG